MHIGVVRLFRGHRAVRIAYLLQQHDDTALFFPEGPAVKVSAWERLAKAVCRRCPVSADCLISAVNRGEEFGVWGGMTERERYRKYGYTAKQEVV